MKFKPGDLIKLSWTYSGPDRAVLGIVISITEEHPEGYDLRPHVNFRYLRIPHTPHLIGAMESFPTTSGGWVRARR